MTHRFLSICLLLSLALCGCRKEAKVIATDRAVPGAHTPSYEDEISTWRAGRISRLKADDGWLTLAGLFWLREGDNRVGSGAGNPVMLPSGKTAESVGVLRREGSKVHFQPATGVTVLHEGTAITAPMLLESDKKGMQTILEVGPVSFYLIERGDRLGIRVKDRESEGRKAFKGIESYPVDPKWRVEATFRPYDPPKEIPITNIIGIVETMKAPGSLTFTIDGQQYSLDPLLEEGSDELFLIFRDKTSGRTTYGAGRYLYAPMPKQGKVPVDFNKAYNPPCAFTPYATCPLPPSQNRLTIEVTAGEKTFKGVSH